MTSKFPTSDFLRENYYLVKGNYKRIISTARKEYFEKLNADIEEGKVLNWQSFKKLKQSKKDTLKFDSYDMKRFENFFTDLYSDKHKTISQEKNNSYQ